MGTAISEVEVDLLTGTHTILRSDVNMHGVGLTTTEEPLWVPDG